MTRVFPDFNELVAGLAKRGVIVTVKGKYSRAQERMSYSADVAMDPFEVPFSSWPRMEFTVYGRELNELADDIVARLPLVEPIIAAYEAHQKHKAAIKEAEKAGAELAAICIPSLEPNNDPKTAKEQPLKVAA